MFPALLRLHPFDNVAVAVEHCPSGRTYEGDGFRITPNVDIPRGHKAAILPIAFGHKVIKYGCPIGHAVAAIEPGDWVHTHNLKTDLQAERDYAYRPVAAGIKSIGDGLTFDGFPRSSGEVGIRNEIWILPTVGCVNHVAESLARERAVIPPRGTLEGIHAFAHPFGCSQLGEDLENTRKILAALAKHPNAGGVLIVGLGCENNQLAGFRELLGDADPARFRFLAAQEVEDEMVSGRRLLDELIALVSQAVRRPRPISMLRVGLKCGGSDGFSGITANPLVGRFSDLLVARGGTTVLTEVPEMFGAETLLMKRCETIQVFNRCVSMINDFKRYYLLHGQPIYENPSPGNKDGGISTLEEKSLGCIQKGGSAAVTDVLAYGDRLSRPGLNLLSGPGNDLVSVTALAAAGVHLILFTTGCGTPLGGPVPTVKISSHTDLAARKKNWIDFNAGSLLEGDSLDVLAERFFVYVLSVVQGRQRTQAEINGFREIAIFKNGVTL
jgi:altronate hydrolase